METYIKNAPVAPSSKIPEQATTKRCMALYAP
jgi:hypothetical protein